jgi:hypothetical protein
MDVVGPFLTPTVLIDAFPNGLEGHQPDSFKRLRIAYAEWSDSNEPAYHLEWIRFVLKDILGFQTGHILTDQAIPSTLEHLDRTHQVVTRPDIVLTLPEFPDRGRVLVIVLPKGTSTSKPPVSAKWQTSPQSRMQLLLAATGEKLGLVTNGEEWTLVNACGSGSVGFATWYAYLWLEEQITQQSFRSLIGLRRIFGAEPGKRLADLLAKSAEDQKDVTDRLGYQVRRAVEEFIGALERLDRGSNREFLKAVPDSVIYEGVLTVMMRLVFLFCAEERGLLRLGEELYDNSYAVSTLREQLHDVAGRHGEEVLERRFTGWSRLLATFRIVYQGVDHEDLRLPAYGGTLFDPDRYPWLEGRTDEGQADPPLIDDRIVLHLLDALQVLRERGGQARKLSFRALDVEQIGHVYEGLLDHTAKRASHPVLGLIGKEGDEPEVDLELLETMKAEGHTKLTAFLKEATGKNERILQQLLTHLPDSERIRKLRIACGDDTKLFERCRPWANLIREGSFDHVQVFPVGALYCTAGSDRRSTGTHYTPRSLCEEVVRYALEPLVYVGPAEGLPQEEWQLKEAKAIVDLNVCDMAMGSGAFLVAACRYLSERLAEAWAIAEEKASRSLGFSAEGYFFTHRIDTDHHAKKPGTHVTTPFGTVAVADPSRELIPQLSEERLALARRIVADRCLFGVDRNAMAVEMAKLSLWLTTLRRDRPFTFLDHALRHGDSLLGVTERQLEMFGMDTSGQSQALLLPWVPEYVDKVRGFRQQIARIPSHDPEAIRRKQILFNKVRELELPLKFAADALISCELSEGNTRDKSARRSVIQATLTAAPPNERLATAYPGLAGRPTFHWELEFPEVFSRGGFDALVGNPPFLGGKKITGILGTDYRDFLVGQLAEGKKGSADICAYFFLRAYKLIAENGGIGLTATSAMSEGDTREVGFDQLFEKEAVIYRATTSQSWAGAASVTIVRIWIRKSAWSGDVFLDDRQVTKITPFLTEPGNALGKPFRLAANHEQSFIGSVLSGTGFILEPAEAVALLDRNPKNRDILFRYMVGEDLNTHPNQQPSRWVINFNDWPLDADHDSPISPKGPPYASDYSECLGIVRAKVKPSRDGLNRRIYRERWWQFAERCAALYVATRKKERAIGISRVTSHAAVAFISPSYICSETMTVFPFNGFEHFALLQSSIHQLWARAYSSTNLALLRYSPSDCFDTFPFPQDLINLEKAGQEYENFRSNLMQVRQEGLTKIYNRFHDRSEQSEDIARMRELHVEIDQAVAVAYGWSDLDLSHGFHATKQGERYTLSESVRRTVLDRLLTLNHQRFAEEVAAGVHDKKSKASSNGTKRGCKPNTSSSNVAETRAGYNDQSSRARNLFDPQLTLGEAED